MRERNEPITLFGENEQESYLRLKKLELLEPEVNKVCAIDDGVPQLPKHNQSLLTIFSIRIHGCC